MKSGNEACPLCNEIGGALVWETRDWRLIRARIAEFPATYRLIANRHIAELTDLDAAERTLCIEYVAAVETALRATISPDKVNLASLGNRVSHLHWHVIARFTWDSRFPEAVWAPAERDVVQPLLDRLEMQLTTVDAVIADALDDLTIKRSLYSAGRNTGS